MLTRCSGSASSGRRVTDATRSWRGRKGSEEVGFAGWKGKQLYISLSATCLRARRGGTSPARTARFCNGRILEDLGDVSTAPFQMKLLRSGRERDVLFVSTAHRARLQPIFLHGPADLNVAPGGGT